MKNDTEIKLTINTGGKHKSGNYIEERRQQIERAGIYIHSLFNAIGKMADSEIAVEAETVYDIKCLTELGKSLSQFISYDNNAFYQAEKDLGDINEPN